MSAASTRPFPANASPSVAGPLPSRLGVQQIHLGVPHADRITPLELIGEKLIGPAAAL